MDYSANGTTNIVTAMYIGDKGAIIEGLSHNGALVRINGIIFATKHKMKSLDVIEKISRLKNDTQWYDGYSVSQFAVASLHILGAENYLGDDETILDLINSEFVF